MQFFSVVSALKAAPLLLLISLTTAACGKTEAPEKSALATHSIDPYENRLMPFMLQRPDSSAILSPYSLWQMSTLLWAGSGGATHESLRALVFPAEGNRPVELSGQEPLTDLSDLAKRYNPFVTSSLGLFVKDGITFFPEFLSLVRRDYPNTTLASAPFDTDPKGSIATINDAVKRATQGRLTQAMTEDDINRETVSALIATLTFRGEWQSKFDSERTHKDIFHSGAKGDLPCSMMQQMEMLRYYAKSGWVYVALPFRTNGATENSPKFMCELTLPPESKSDITYIDFVQAARAFSKEAYVDFSMPKFVLKTRTDLKPLYEMMGISSAFDDRADFRKISATPLVLQKIFQVVQLEVNEEGAEVEAATVATMKIRSCAPRTPDAIVNINRPFFITVRETRAAIPILFAHIASLSCDDTT